MSPLDRCAVFGKSVTEDWIHSCGFGHLPPPPPFFYFQSYWGESGSRNLLRNMLVYKGYESSFFFFFKWKGRKDLDAGKPSRSGELWVEQRFIVRVYETLYANLVQRVRSLIEGFCGKVYYILLISMLLCSDHASRNSLYKTKCPIWACLLFSHFVCGRLRQVRPAVIKANIWISITLFSVPVFLKLKFHSM